MVLNMPARLLSLPPTVSAMATYVGWRKSLLYLGAIPSGFPSLPRHYITVLRTTALTPLHQRLSLLSSNSTRSSSSKANGIYSADLPDDLVTDPRIKSFYENFFKVADESDAHEAYAESFYTKDAVFVLGGRAAQGRDQICELRKTMWTGPIKSRQHTLRKIFPFGNQSKEVMMYGTCVYSLWNGKAVTLDWAAQASLEVEGHDLKMSYYRVYLDSVLIANAAKENQTD